MITREELLKNPGQVKIKALINGPFGVGKTYTAMTFPKFAYAMVEPNGLATAMSNPHLMANLVYYEDFVARKDESLKDTFTRISQFCDKVREDMKAGKVESCILDNLTHYAENRWMYMDAHEKSLYMTANGAVNSLQMYGGLGRFLYKTILTEFVSLPGHVAVPVHEFEEEENQQTPQGEKRVKTGRIISNVLGGFRKDAAGLFNVSMFLERKAVGPGKYTFRARCIEGGGKPAKNNLNLPEFVENVSFQTLVEALGRGSGSATGGTV